MIGQDTKDWLRSVVAQATATEEHPTALLHAKRLLDILANPSTGVELIAAERLRQVEAKGFTAEHDDSHVAGEIAVAAASLAMYHTKADGISGTFHDQSGHPIAFIETWMHDLVRTCSHKTDVRRLAIAGAMIAAEIDRLQRLAARRNESIREQP